MSLGLYPSIFANANVNNDSARGKWPAFVWAALSVLRRYPFLNVRVGVEGKELISRTPFVFIGNNEYEMETLNVGSRACLDKGRLSLYMTNRTGRLGLIRLALRALFGGLRQEKDFLSLCTKEIWIGTRHKVCRGAGRRSDSSCKPPLHYRSACLEALRVITPARKDEQETTS